MHSYLLPSRQRHVQSAGTALPYPERLLPRPSESVGRYRAPSPRDPLLDLEARVLQRRVVRDLDAVHTPGCEEGGRPSLGRELQAVGMGQRQAVDGLEFAELIGNGVVDIAPAGGVGCSGSRSARTFRRAPASRRRYRELPGSRGVHPDNSIRAGFEYRYPSGPLESAPGFIPRT